MSVWPPPPDGWEKNPKIYPPAKEIVIALQDQGVNSKSKTKGQGEQIIITKFPLIIRLAGTFFNNIKSEYPNSALAFPFEYM